MDVASARWLSEMAVEDYHNIFHQCEIHSLNQLGFASDDHTVGENYKKSLSSESYSSYSTVTTKNNNPSISTSSGSDSFKNSHQAMEKKPPFSSSSSQLLSFDQKYSNSPPNSKPHDHQQLLIYGNLDNMSTTLKPKKEAVSQIDVHFSSHVITNKDSLIKKEDHSCEPITAFTKGNNKRPYSAMTRTPSHAQDHIMAERKRREKLSQRFIALSAIVPGLKKMDKASVLGDAIKYVKQLQERVNILEEQTKKRTVESVVFVKKSHVSADDQDSSSCDQNFDGRSHDQDDHQALPEIEARVSEKDVLMRIHCEKQKGVAVKILSEIEKLDHLSVVNTSVLPFGNSTLDVTIIAKMDEEFSMTVKDLVKNLREALLKFM
ncbi:Basic helix-loop-helix transcription factor [Parasponia andersonii]|uniref:Basic helix-loop-helix transcription factor n=1 Tax=Parasponia andersonii TaxID=3476 RepID=A0A2P5BIT4_PARAD|nr:Basic helix-loop-helix transcription factor [Parasponia andersonii]